MNILIIGGGGREHALAWKISQSPLCRRLYVAPGNAGTGKVATNVQIDAMDFDNLGSFCLANDINLVVVGPEGPLVKGIRDHFESREDLRGILFIGPGKSGARLEGSKHFSKDFMGRHNIPTAKARTFEHTHFKEALEYLNQCKPPIVIKADGLAAGKGVIIALSQNEAKKVLEDMLLGKMFGEASSSVLIEEFLSGVELSVFVLTDGKNYVILPEAKDYKRIGDGDTGPNTGGMGAVSPVIFADASFMERVKERIVIPSIEGLHKEGIPYVGFLFIGLMNVGGNPYVIEYNARLGDPETQVVLPRIAGDFVELLVAAAKGELAGKSVAIDPRYALTISLVSGGYPGEFKKGKVIRGLGLDGEALTFHAGTKAQDGSILTDGGRVVAVTALGASLEHAREAAYEEVSKINWDGLFYRKDIGLDLMKYKS